MEDYSPVFFASVISLIVGFILGYRRSHVPTYDFQNRGEKYLSDALLARFRPPDYHLLNHVTLRTTDGTTQVDHVLVSRFGVFVIETKDYSGWIFANPVDRQWTQVLYRVKFGFRNPVHQNFKHLCAVRHVLDFVPPGDIHSVVVFLGSAEFKTAIPEGVFHLPEFIAHLEGKSTEVMSINRVQFCVGRLETMRLSLTMATDVEHVQGLRHRHRNSE